MPRLFDKDADGGSGVEPPLNSSLIRRNELREVHLTQTPSVSSIFNMPEQLDLDLDLIVLNCTLATVEEVVQCDIGVKDEKIHSIVPQGSLAESKAKKIIDAKEALVTVRLFRLYHE